jgi:hypothetical protein
MSVPVSPSCGFWIKRSCSPVASSRRKRRPRSSWISRTALTTPRVTSSTGASTVVGASPRQVRRYSPASLRSMRMALVVVEPQSVAITERIDAGSIAGLPWPEGAWDMDREARPGAPPPQAARRRATL